MGVAVHDTVALVKPQIGRSMQGWTYVTVLSRSMSKGTGLWDVGQLQGLDDRVLAEKGIVVWNVQENQLPVCSRSRSHRQVISTVRWGIKEVFLEGKVR